VKLWSSTHFLTTSSSFTIFTRDLKASNGIGEPLGVQLAELVLVIVVFGGRESCRSCRIAHKGVFALGRSVACVRLVKRGEMNLEHVRDASFSLNHGVSSSAQANSGCMTVPSAFFLHSEQDGVTLRLRQNDLRNLEQRISAAVTLIWRASDSTPFSSGKKVTVIPATAPMARAARAHAGHRAVVAAGKSLLAVAELGPGTRRTGPRRSPNESGRGPPRRPSRGRSSRPAGSRRISRRGWRPVFPAPKRAGKLSRSISTSEILLMSNQRPVMRSRK